MNMQTMTGWTRKKKYSSTAEDDGGEVSTVSSAQGLKQILRGFRALDAHLIAVGPTQ